MTHDQLPKNQMNAMHYETDVFLLLFTLLGTDELSQNLSKLINDERVSSILRTDKFVAIKIQGDSESYIQFAQICKCSKSMVKTN